jgi:hypothetical protein
LLLLELTFNAMMRLDVNPENNATEVRNGLMLAGFGGGAGGVGMIKVP